MNQISFMTANYVARRTGWNMTGGWDQGDAASTAYFKPPATFGARLAEYLADVRALGFSAIDVWTGVLSAAWATPEHIAAAQEALRRHEMAVASLAGWMGGTREEFVAACAMARALGAPVLGGGTPLQTEDRPFVVATLKEYGLRLGIENHPETPAEMLAKIGDGGDGTIGTTVDTGWYGTHGIDAAEAIARLAPHIVLVHLKDVREVGAHNTCRFGAGVVPVERCVRALQAIGYTGSISIEHEPADFDPAADIAASRALLEGWLQA
jgi:sugar phosphate isomerase/epimerase